MSMGLKVSFHHSDEIILFGRVSTATLINVLIFRVTLAATNLLWLFNPFFDWDMKWHVGNNNI